MRKIVFDQDVYEFYRAALEGPGFAASFAAPDLERLREEEITRHAAHTEPYEVYRKEDILIERDDADALPVRVYIPESVAEAGEPSPVILYFHGGGFIMGSIEDHDPLCGKLADECSAIVLAPEYRLAPEHPFPACIEDAVALAKWAEENACRFGGDPSKILAGGDSSGANISAALALLAKEGKAPGIAGLILFYGTYGCIDVEESESARMYGQGGFVLPVSSINTMMELYIPEGTDPDDVRLAPGKAPDLSGMPPAVIVSAEFDPLRDDGEEFARRLEENGSEVSLIRMDGMMHGFVLYWQSFRRAEALLEEIGEKIRERFSGRAMI